MTRRTPLTPEQLEEIQAVEMRREGHTYVVDVRCAWCGVVYGRKGGFGVPGTTGGACPACTERMIVEIRNERKGDDR